MIVKTLATLVVTGLIATSSSAAFAHEGDGKGRHGEGKRGGGGGSVTSLVTAGTLTQAQADSFKAAMKTKLDAKFAIKLNTVLTDLVSNQR